MTCFDALADENYGKKSNDWLNDARYARRYILNTKIIQKKNGKTTEKDGLTYQREVFLRNRALRIEEKDHKDETRSPQGSAKPLPCLRPSWMPESNVNLSIFPRYSARLLLTFRLLTPLLTKDDDPFYLFDNPARKDHLLGLPYLSAASLKGLSADAYQRAFPNPRPWLDLGKDDPDRTRAFRHADPHARRLFGIADDGAKIESEKGRLHFAPVWFNSLQLLVMNPGDPKTAMGTLPIQFEAVAPDQTGVLEVVYFNPHGVKDSDEATVRADLARWLGAVATWWPVLGLGAKRLAGYGAIQIIKAELQAVGWSGLSEEKSAIKPAASTMPEYVTRFTINGQLIDRDTLQAQSKAQRGAWEQQPEVQTLEKEKENLQTLPKNRRKKERDRIKKQLAELRQPLDETITSQEKAYNQAVAWLKEHPEFGQTAMTDSLTVTEALPVLSTRVETGPDSWLNLARWIAGETA